MLCLLWMKSNEIDFIHLNIPLCKNRLLIAGGFFVRKNEVIRMGKEKNILCPKCRRKVGKHDGKSTIIKTIKCKYCEAFVVYNPITDKTTKGKEIERWASSGKRFY